MQQITSVNPMAIQLNFLQVCIMALTEKFGADETGKMLDQVVETLDRSHAVVVTALIKAMRCPRAVN